jgi:aminoglycoside 3-N-acetyltransferase
LRRLKSVAKPLLIAVHGEFTAAELERELRAKIGGDFDVLMVHSSLDGFRPHYRGNVYELLDMFRNLCGPDRTLVMPAFYLGPRDEGWKNYYKRHPNFDTRRKPSQMGMLTELFRRQPGVRHSLHPTHRVSAIGPHAETIVSGHHLCATTHGPGSPFGVMNSLRTVILGAGIPYSLSLTHLHYTEALLGKEFPGFDPRNRIAVSLINEKGEKFSYDLLTDKPKGTPRPERLRQLIPRDILYQWRFRGVVFYRTEAAQFSEILSDHARHGRTIYC